MPVRPSEAQLTVYQPDVPPLVVSPPTQTITLGRSTDCTVPIKDRFLSRKHAEITFDSGSWIVRDFGSVNGTLLNGKKIEGSAPLRPGDRISLGDTEVVFNASVERRNTSDDTFVALDRTSHSRNLAIPLHDAIDERDRQRASVLAAMAAQFIEDRPMSELFDFILDKVFELLRPSRTAIALLADDGSTFETVLVRRRNAGDGETLTISRTLLKEVIDGRSVVSFVDRDDEKLAQAQSIIGQSIRSAICAPLLIGDTVRGVLYLDFVGTSGGTTHEDLRLVAQTARLAGVKLETTRLREEALVKAKLDAELRTAYTVQSRLLPAVLPQMEGYVFAGMNKPCRTVSGDYYDVVERPDGRIYFIIADVSGKGITAALVMASLATAFNIFTRTDPTPAALVRELNCTLAPKTSPTKFVTLVVGLLDPSTGVVQFANAGHVPPLVVRESGVEQLTTTDLVIGLFTSANYREQSVTIGPGESLVLFTDGVTEAENESEEQLGLEPIVELLRTMRQSSAPELVQKIENHTRNFCGHAPAADDVTMLALTRTKGNVE